MKVSLFHEIHYFISFSVHFEIYYFPSPLDNPQLMSSVDLSSRTPSRPGTIVDIRSGTTTDARVRGLTDTGVDYRGRLVSDGSSLVGAGAVYYSLIISQIRAKDANCCFKHAELCVTNIFVWYIGFKGKIQFFDPNE